MGITVSPSSARLCQRFDEGTANLLPLLKSASVEFLHNAPIPLTGLSTGHIPLGMDVLPMDNSDTKKEGVSYTYKGHDGYSPMADHMGQQGWCLGCELRPSSKHANSEFISVLTRIIPRARQLTDQSILIRLDSAHDALENRIF